MRAPDWFREQSQPGGARPPPPTSIFGSGAPPPPSKAPPLAVSSVAARSSGAGSSSLVPAALQGPQLHLQRARPAQPPALAALPPPPPPPGTVGAIVALQAPVPAALAALPVAPAAPAPLAISNGPGGGRRGSNSGTSQALATVGRRTAAVHAAPKKGEGKGGAQAFTIPGLQDRPFSEQELLEAWEMMDLDGHGSLDVQDLQRVLQLCGEGQATDAELEMMVRMLDKNAKGMAMYPEFFKAFTAPPPIFRNWDLHLRTLEEEH